jgi:atypical dual specificity phosphatase
MSVTRVFERLYLGSTDDVDQLAVSNPLGITTVVNVRREKNRTKRKGLVYVHIPLADAEFVPAGTLELVLTAIGQNIRKGRVLVHCAAGMSRSPAMVAMYMHYVGYKNLDAALRELKGLRSIVNPSRVILESIKDFLRA